MIAPARASDNSIHSAIIGRCKGKIGFFSGGQPLRGKIEIGECINPLQGCCDAPSALCPNKIPAFAQVLKITHPLARPLTLRWFPITDDAPRKQDVEARRGERFFEAAGNLKRAFALGRLQQLDPGDALDR